MQAGTKIGEYRLLVQTGEGTLGGLWAARAVAGERSHAVMSMRVIAESPRLRSGDVVELEKAAGWALQLPPSENVLAGLDVVSTGSRVGIVSEYVEGETISSLLGHARSAGKKVPVPVALRIVLDLLVGLQGPHGHAGAAPELTYAFGGITPDNVLVGRDGRSWLLDVAVAGKGATLARLRTHPDVCAYRAPEQLEQSGKATPGTDVFSVGAILWELVAGARLFGGATGVAVQKAVKHDPIPRLDAPEHAALGVGEQVASVVQRALKRNLLKRFSSAAAFQREIRDLPDDLLAEPAGVAELLRELASDVLEERRETIERALATSSPAPPAGREPESDAAPTLRYHRSRSRTKPGMPLASPKPPEEARPAELEPEGVRAAVAKVELKKVAARTGLRAAVEERVDLRGDSRVDPTSEPPPPVSVSPERTEAQPAAILSETAEPGLEEAPILAVAGAADGSATRGSWPFALGLVASLCVAVAAGLELAKWNAPDCAAPAHRTETPPVRTPPPPPATAPRAPPPPPRESEAAPADAGALRPRRDARGRAEPPTKPKPKARRAVPRPHRPAPRPKPKGFTPLDI